MRDARRTASGILVASVMALSLVTGVAGTAIAEIVCQSPPSGLTAWWPGDGDTVDIDSGHDGQLLNGATFAPGFVDQAFSLDGSNDLIEVPDDPAWTFGDHAFTIDAWVNFASLPQRAPIVSHDEGPANTKKWIFWFDSVGHEGLPGNALRFHINKPNRGQTRDTVSAFWTPTLNQWHHVAVTRLGDRYRLFIDGVGVALDWDQARIPDANAPLQIGAAEGIHFDGLIDEVEIFDKALRRNQIAKIVAAGPAGKCKPS